ncbi:hypothetical protein IQ266_17165 [filamentous cyanobacterium LEGE 11480]|uniref:Uncharacterized protein n=1 Tax=Romeriopsis navalis LEGE 11480 TaxID=2777977 RepID=A0A928VPP1_9CYAN|nr:hypothetical protein [Romeriopsis navalis]MBE9031467.1 hypothetical protein [Romeriopsis navalis LEGE 11480]
MNRSAEEAARIILEIARRLRLNQKQRASSLDGELLQPETTMPIPEGQPLTDTIGVDALYERELPSAEIPLIEAEVIQDRPLALPSIQHRPEQVAAQTVEQMVDGLGENGVYQAESYTMTRDLQAMPINVASGGAQMQVEETIYRVYEPR